jgi:sister-chromatid-cohesion protein PDS5
MQYLKLLQRLAHFKVGVVLVEMTKTLGLESEYDTDIAEDHHHYRSSRDSPSSEDTMEILRELIEVLLNNIQIEHPNEVKALAVSSICGCIEEFYNTVPIPILDEILTCVGRGPIIHVTNPEYVKATAALAAAKKRGKKVDKAKLPPPQLKQTNQSYMVACNVIKKTLDKISTPIASLLNGLLNGDTNITKYSNIGSTDEQPDAEKGTIIAAVGCMIEKEEQIADVWNIVYELHKVSPQILTTVIGTVASSLESPDDKKRFQVTKLLGRLFYSKSSDIGAKFFLCFKDWIKRSMDSNEEIRMMMIRSIIEILRNKGKETNLCEEATYALVKIATSEPSNDVRIKCIHKICDFIYYAEDSESTISTQLLQAVGNRISSKHKKERISALGGLAKIYYRQYMSKILKHAQEGGDDCSIGIILDTIHNNCDLQTYTTGKQTRKGKKKKSTSPKRSTIRYNDNNLDEKYKFISDKIFDSAFFTDKLDPMMRSSVYQVVDTIILGGYEGETSERNTKGKSLTNTSRAIGLAIIMNHLSTSHKDAIDQGESGTSLMWMCSLLAKRAQLQQALNAYITCKVESEKYPSGKMIKLFNKYAISIHNQKLTY